MLMDMIEIIKNAEKEYMRWMENYNQNDEYYEDLKDLSSDETERIDCFYTHLNFGTSGMRGILGPGPNRINSLVIKRASQGLSNFIIKNYKNPSVVVCYDSRKGSSRYGKETAGILNGNGIKTYLFDELAPVPCLSYAIKKLNCDMGIMITASHNPKFYNGYKVYNKDGYQIVGKDPLMILDEIEALDFFDKFPYNENGINYVKEDVKRGYIDEILGLSSRLNSEVLNSLKTIYTPFNGTGMKFAQKVFDGMGYTNHVIVESQRCPDPNFTTCPQPNPEKLLAFNEGFNLLDKIGADIIVGTDPDADRIGMALYHDGMRRLLTGNELGILILDYLCHIKPPKKGQIICKSVMTSPLGERIGNKFHLKTINTLPGFKHIGNILKDLEDKNELDRFYYGFEESNGYLINPFVREKDGISGSMIAIEMAAFNKSMGKNPIERLEEIYSEYGMCKDNVNNYFFQGIKGKFAMDDLMTYFREKIKDKIGNHIIVNKVDYMDDTRTSKANIVQFDFDDGSMLAIRPSGTESKLKVYSFATENFADVKKEIKDIIDKFKNSI